MLPLWVIIIILFFSVTVVSISIALPLTLNKSGSIDQGGGGSTIITDGNALLLVSGDTFIQGQTVADKIAVGDPFSTTDQLLCNSSRIAMKSKSPLFSEWLDNGNSTGQCQLYTSSDKKNITGLIKASSNNIWTLLPRGFKSRAWGSTVNVIGDGIKTCSIALGSFSTATAACDLDSECTGISVRELARNSTQGSDIGCLHTSNSNTSFVNTSVPTNGSLTIPTFWKSPSSRPNNGVYHYNQIQLQGSISPSFVADTMTECTRLCSINDACNSSSWNAIQNPSDTNLGKGYCTLYTSSRGTYTATTNDTTIVTKKDQSEIDTTSTILTDTSLKTGNNILCSSTLKDRAYASNQCSFLNECIGYSITSSQGCLIKSLTSTNSTTGSTIYLNDRSLNQDVINIDYNIPNYMTTNVAGPYTMIINPQSQPVIYNQVQELSLQAYDYKEKDISKFANASFTINTKLADGSTTTLFTDKLNCQIDSDTNSILCVNNNIPSPLNLKQSIGPVTIVWNLPTYSSLKVGNSNQIIYYTK